MNLHADRIAPRKIELGADADRPAVLVGGMPVHRAVGSTVIGAAGVVQRNADAGIAPGLIDAQVGDDVGHPETEVAVIDRKGVVIGHRTVGSEEARRGRIEGEGLVRRCVFERERGGEAVAELGGIGP